MKLYSPKEYLLIDIANNFGYDKLNFDERIEKAEKIVNSFSFDLGDKLDNQFLNKYCEEVNEVEGDPEEAPYLAFASMRAWGDYLHKRPSGYPICLDMTSSGSQILAMITGDYHAGSLCNLTGGDRKDLYTHITEEIGIKDFKRVDVKQAIMTLR